MMGGSCGAVACGAAKVEAARVNASATKTVRIRIEIPSKPIVSGRIAVEKVMRAAYNRSHCLSIRTANERSDRQISGGRAASTEVAPVPGKTRRSGMAYVIAEPCIGTKDTACVDVCPVDC